MVDRLHVTEDFGKMPKEKRFARRDWRAERDFVYSDSKRFEHILLTYLRPNLEEEPSRWNITLRLPISAFWQKVQEAFVNLVQRVLGDKFLIINRTRVVNALRIREELEQLWGERENGTLPQPTVIQLQIALEDVEDDG